MSEVPTSMPTSMPTSIPTSMPTSIPTMIPTYNLTTILNDDNLLHPYADDDNDLKLSIIAAIVLGSIGFSYIMYISYRAFGGELYKKLRRWYKRNNQSQSDNLARIMPMPV